MKKIFLSSVAVLAFATAGHADELSDIRAQSKQIREQLTKRLAGLEKRQQKLEQQSVAQAAVPHINPVDAMAADLPYKAAVKAPAPVDNSLCWHGVCLYGAMDIGLAYQNHGAPLSAFATAPLDYLVGKTSNGSYFGAAAGQLSTSYIGLRGKQEVADNLYAVFNLQTLFVPLNGLNGNGPGSVVQNNGILPAQQNAGGDSSKAGQMFNQAAYFGVSSPTYGTFTMGRQTTLSSDLITNYDPNAGANNFSLLTYQGVNGGGGFTENRAFDNSYEYRVNIGPVRLAGEIQAKNGGNSGTGNGFQGNVGFDYLGFSFDVVGSKIYDAVGISSLSAAQVLTITGSGINTGLGPVAAIVADTTAFQVAGRYVIGPWKLFAGYENIHFANPDNPLAPGAFIVGGYTVGVPNNTNFTTDKIVQTFWAGARYSVNHDLDLTAAWYHEIQNSWVNAANPTGTCNTPVASSCSGSLDAVSFVADWRFARQFDTYAGVMWSQAQNGMINGFVLATPGVTKVAVWAPGVGLRYQF